MTPPDPSPANYLRKAARGSFLVAASKAATEGGRMLKLFILARLLAPEHFGAMGLALFVQACLEAFTETGLQAAAVQRRESFRPLANTLFTAQLLRGVLLAGALAAAAPALSAYFQAEALAPLLLLVAAGLLARGASNPLLLDLQRELAFGRLTLLNVAETTVDLGGSIAAAFWFRDARALAIGSLAGQLARTTLSYAVYPCLPKLDLDRARLRTLGVFGLWASGHNILLFLSTQIDRLIVGKVLGLTALGYYSLATKAADITRTLTTEILSQIAFPLFSRLQEDPDALRRAFARLSALLAAANLLLTTALVLFTDEIVRVLFGRSWEAVVPLVRILALASFVRSFTVLGGWLFFARKRPRINVAMSASKLVALAVLLLPFLREKGLPGAAWAVVVSTCATLPFFFYGLRVTLGRGQPREAAPSDGAPPHDPPTP